MHLAPEPKSLCVWLNFDPKRSAIVKSSPHEKGVAGVSCLSLLQHFWWYVGADLLEA